MATTTSYDASYGTQRRAPSASHSSAHAASMPAPARVTLRLQLRPSCGVASRRGGAAARRAPRPARASSEPEKEEERIYVAPNWVRYPLPGSPAGADALAPPPPAPQAAPPPAGLARLSRADAAGIVMSAVFGMGAPLPGAEQARRHQPIHPPCQRSTRSARRRAAAREAAAARRRHADARAGDAQDPPVPIPLSSSPRRTRVVSFLCNVCDQRTLRRVNPAALETGTTFVQCRRVCLGVGAPVGAGGCLCAAAVFAPRFVLAPPDARAPRFARATQQRRLPGVPQAGGQPGLVPRATGAALQSLPLGQVGP